MTITPSTSGFSTVTNAPTPTSTAGTTGTEAPVLPVVTEVNGTPAISGGHVTEPIPITETETIDPSGTEATSSAEAIQTELDNLYPIIQSYIDESSEEDEDDSDNAIIVLLPLAAVSSLYLLLSQHFFLTF